MIAGVAFDLGVGQFTATDVASLCGVKRPVIDTMGTRGWVNPRRRGQAPTAIGQQTGKRRAKGVKGRPLFSFTDVLKVRLMRSLVPYGVGFGNSSVMADPDKMEVTGSEAALAAISELTDQSEGWSWGMARSIERGAPFCIYAYATLPGNGNKWKFDVHIEIQSEKPTEPPRFRWNVPHIFVPVGEIFIATYNDCKKMLGITAG